MVAVAGIVSLCSGVAGLDRAVEAVTGQHVECCVEFEPHLREFLKREYPEALILDDVKTVDWSVLGGDATESRDRVLTAGFP